MAGNLKFQLQGGRFETESKPEKFAAQLKGTLAKGSAVAVQTFAPDRKTPLAVSFNAAKRPARFRNSVSPLHLRPVSPYSNKTKPKQLEIRIFPTFGVGQAGKLDRGGSPRPGRVVYRSYPWARCLPQIACKSPADCLLIACGCLVNAHRKRLQIARRSLADRPKIPR
jgi:hypothetical protein